MTAFWHMLCTFDMRYVNVMRKGCTMVREILFDRRPDVLLGKMLDKAALNQRIIASNVANVNTPGYERLGVSFDEVLKRAVRFDKINFKRTSPKHLPEPDWLNKIKPEVVKVDNGYWNGINNVDIDREMVELAKNQLDFNIAAKIKNLRSTQLRTAIRGRR